MIEVRRWFSAVELEVGGRWLQGVDVDKMAAVNLWAWDISVLCCHWAMPTWLVVR